METASVASTSEPSLRTPNNKCSHPAATRLVHPPPLHSHRHSPAVRSKLAGPATPSIKPLSPHNHQHATTTTAASSASSSSPAPPPFYTTPQNRNHMQRIRTAHRFHIFPTVNNTPPSRGALGGPHAKPRTITNPFEAELVERLHLPLICSPSLFHQPSTPQHSSTQFEWTIDDVSELNPTNVEAHETQFMSVLDPEQEARAQAAISTYFKEGLTVPSPVDCPLRKMNIESLMPARCRALKAKGQPRRRRSVRDAVCQTVVTLPPRLPAAVEEALRPFCTYTQEQQQEHSEKAEVRVAEDEGDVEDDEDGVPDEEVIDHEARDASLRRKLFNTSPRSERSSDGGPEMLDGVELVNLSPPPGSPELSSADGLRDPFRSPHNRRRTSGAHSFRLSVSPVLAAFAADSTNVNKTRRTSDNSFGSLSPIARSQRCDGGGNTTAAFVGHRSAELSSRSLNRSRSRHTSNNSSSAFCQSTPGSSGRYRTCSLGGTLGGSLENMTLNSNATAAAAAEAVGRSRSRLAVRNLSRSFDSERERDERPRLAMDALMLSVERLRRHIADGSPERRRRSTGADDDTVDGSSPDSSTTGSSSVHSGTPSRKVSWSNRKNLSLSFDDDCADDDDGVDQGEGDDDKPKGNGDAEPPKLLRMPDDVNVSMVDVSAAEHRIGKLDGAEASDSMIAAKGLCQTDSGFNEMEV